MKKIFTAILLITYHCSFAQCKTLGLEGSVSLHLTADTRNGFGGELGMQGILSNFSGFLGMDVTSTKGFKDKDSTVSLFYVKGLYRFYQNYNEDLYFAAVLAPAVMNTDFEFLSGLRLLYVTGTNTAVSVEPLWYLSEKKFHLNINLHFLM
jgi:hypothetical protein